ncbi:MAG: glycosyltransferase family 4 protein [Roseibium sp.]
MPEQKIFFAYPGNLETPTGGYGYDRRIISGLRASGWDVETVSLGDGFPFPSIETLANAEHVLSELPENSLVIVDGLAFGAMPEIAQKYSGNLRLIALVHHPLCQENGLSPEQACSLQFSENTALQNVEKVIVTSPATAEQVTRLFGVPEGLISTIVPGTDIPDPVDRKLSETVNLLSVGTVVPRKGYDLLFDALSGVSHENWHLSIVGGTDSDVNCYNALVKMARDLKLSDQISFHGGVPEGALTEFYQSADIFVLASRYEGYGMAYTEAMAHGLPVIGSGAGAVEGTLASGAGLYCGIEDVDALREALDLLMSDPEKRSILARLARDTAQKLPSWQDAAAEFERVLLGMAK